MNCKCRAISNPPPSRENSWEKIKAFKTFKFVNVLIIRTCIHIFPSGTKMAFHHLDEIATINSQGYGSNDTATSDHNDKIVIKKFKRRLTIIKINVR